MKRQPTGASGSARAKVWVLAGRFAILCLWCSLGLGGVLWGLSGWTGTLWAAGPKQAEGVGEAQGAFDRQQYDKALSLLQPLLKEGQPPAAVLRLGIKTFLKLGKPAEALKEYERLEAGLGKDDPSLLREVSIGFIAAILKDMREQMRGAGFTALKELNSDDAIPYLEDGLSDGSGMVRALAAEGLARLKAGQRSVRFRKATEDQAAIVRASVLRGLGRTGDKAVIPIVEGLLTDEQPSVRVAAAGALVALGRGEAIAKIREAAKALNPDDRGTAFRMIGHLKDRQSLPMLQEALSDVQPSVRGSAAMALGDLGMAEAVPALVAALGDRIPAVRASAAVSLGEIGAVAAAPELKKALADANFAVRAAALSALLRLGASYDDCADAIRSLTGNTEPNIRAAAAKALSNGHGAEVHGVLKQLLDDPLPRPRIAAAKALGQIGQAEAIPWLKKALKDQDPAVRATAGGAIGRLLSGSKEDV